MMAEILVNTIYLQCCLPVEGNYHIGFAILHVEDMFAEIVPYFESPSKG